MIGTTLLFTLVVAFSFSFNHGLILSLACLVTGLSLHFINIKGSLLLKTIAFSMALAFAIAGFYQYSKILPLQERINTQVDFQGIVTEESSSSATRGAKYTIVATFPQDTLPKSTLIVRDYTDLDITTGDCLKGTLTLKMPKHDSIIEGNLRKGIFVEGEFATIPQILPAPSKYRLFTILAAVRGNILHKLNLSLPKDTASIVGKMVFDLPTNIDSNVYRSFSKAGTYHILSVSGMHLSVFAAFVSILLNKTRLKTVSRNLLAILFVTLFTVVAGLSPPLLRSWVMITLLLIGELIGRRSDPLNSLGFSAIIIATAFPYWVFSWGTWLSFLSTAGILICAKSISSVIYTTLIGRFQLINKLTKAFATSFGVSVAAYVFTVPVFIISLGGFSLVSPIANLLTGGFSSIIIVLGILMGVLPTGFPLYKLMASVVNFSTKVVVYISKIFGRLNFAMFNLSSQLITIVFLLGVVCVLLAFLLKLNGRLKAGIAILVVTALTFTSVVTVYQSTHNLTIATVGDYTILSRGSAAVVIGEPDIFSANLLTDYLEFYGITYIDCLITTSKPKLTSALTSLQEDFYLSSVLGPDDSYLLAQLSDFLPGATVYSNGYANAQLLDCINLAETDETINIKLNNKKIVITSKAYDIINQEDIIISEGRLLLPPWLNYEPELFGGGYRDETRVVISLSRR